MTPSEEYRPSRNNHTIPGSPGEEEKLMQSENFPSTWPPVDGTDILAEIPVAESPEDESDEIADLFSEESFTEFLGEYDGLVAAGKVPTYTAEELTARSQLLFNPAEAAARSTRSRASAEDHKTQEGADAEPTASTEADTDRALPGDALSALAMALRSQHALYAARSLAAELTEDYERFDADLRLNMRGSHRPLRLSFLINGMLLDETGMPSKHLSATSETASPKLVPPSPGTGLSSEHPSATPETAWPKVVPPSLEVLHWLVPAADTHTAAEPRADKLHLASAQAVAPSDQASPALAWAPASPLLPTPRKAVPAWLPGQRLAAWLERRVPRFRPAPARTTNDTSAVLESLRSHEAALSGNGPHMLMIALPARAGAQQWTSLWEAELALRWHEHSSTEHESHHVAAVLLLSCARMPKRQIAHGQPPTDTSEQAAALMIPMPRKLRTEADLTEIQRLVNNAFHECTGRKG